MIKYRVFADFKCSIDIKENDLLKIDPKLLEILLKDKSTDSSLIWATDNYRKHGEQYNSDNQIKIQLITSRNGNIIKPRIQKPKTEQQIRVRQKAEVFTPSWVCNVQNNLVDEAWFGRSNVFNVESENFWNTTPEKIKFPDTDNKTWHDYVSIKRLEVSCGEAPYLTSRYDAVTGVYIDVPNRIGFLDRKLRIVHENTTNRDDWLTWAFVAVQSSYGFDWQGDNVLIARENILFTIIEHYYHTFNAHLTVDDMLNFAKVIAWNIWQMDGLKYVVPNSCTTQTVTETTLFETITHSTECEGCKNGNNLKHNGIYCKIRNWETHQTMRFIDLVGGI